MSAPKTLFDKLWDAHVVSAETDAAPAVLYIDLHLIHEVTSPQAFAELEARGLPVARPHRTVGTLDHSTPTLPADDAGKLPYANPEAEAQVAKLRDNAAKFGVELFDFGSAHRGIVHVIGPELGITQPGMTIVCGDSHTATHGAFGALAFGIGTSEVGHVLATQCLLQRKPKTLAITIDGELGPGVTAKDLILHVIGVIGVNGGTGHVIEYRGSAIRALSMDQRMTVCNMSIEAGARAGLIAPDDAACAAGCRLRCRRRALARIAQRRRRALRSRSPHRRRRHRPHRHLGHASGPGRGDFQPHPGRRKQRRCQGARLHGLGGACTAGWTRRRCGVRRQLHQLAPERPARGRTRAEGPQGTPARAHAGGARLRTGEAGCGSRRHRRHRACRRCGMARAGMLDVHRDERRPGATGAARGLVPCWPRR